MLKFIKRNNAFNMPSNVQDIYNMSKGDITIKQGEGRVYSISQTSSPCVAHGGLEKAALNMDMT